MFQEMMVSSGGGGGELAPLIPVLTSDSGGAFGSSEYSGQEFFHAFTNSASEWVSANNDVSNAYVGFAFSSPVIAKCAMVYGPNIASRMGDFKIQASNNSSFSNPTNLYVGKNNGVSGQIYGALFLDNTTAYQYYRVLIVNTAGASNAGLRQFQLYG